MEKIGLKKIYAAMVLMVAMVFLMRVPIEAGVNGIKKVLPKIAEIEFEDSDGRVILMDDAARRIISLETSHTQNLYSLGAGHLLVGVGYQEVYPLEIGGLEKFNLEKDAEGIISANPDLVLITPEIRRLYRDQTDILLRSGINVVSLYPERLEDLGGYLKKLGMTVGLEKKSELLFDEIMDSLEREKVGAEVGKSASFESSDMEMLLLEDSSVEASMMNYAGGIYEEDTLNADIYFTQTGFKDLGGSLRAVYERKDSEDIKAVRKGKVYEISKSISSPTMMMPKGVREMKRLLDPEEYRSIDYLSDESTLTREVLAEMIVTYAGMQIFYPDYSYFSEERSRYYGDFEDVKPDHEYFEYVETAVGRGILDYDFTSRGMFFNPDEAVTREDFAEAIWMMKSDFEKVREVEIEDLGQCQSPRIVERLVEAGVFETEGNNFNPDGEVTCCQAVEIFEKIGGIND
ncbi:ABC-type Fe3+-hydroxamate transport system, substrate-binding protein [Dethiosulfatibacter aminovorans DSM 17477]|uniref:ABC-type Fe3+-hydroxamate transport system, substrate-binding protein n=1 Tax=Dethiosulfatibacter aminovorans DSM 17477 TaxID=1121476 RepID=A0A1M6EKQ8_9FIRM|nr:S-layer homology domain-containing protein [Dethiosulfatibacter aminovorans]SHI86034.1 ABC-type Fe3+-hydroxamate transport system, substrate-binding protein [Dethiosulfatibacter aminovorans DSM 17477]